ncbi:hypothetical protein CROQUDRAFT_471008 [Cronartium quercuum f. sp. fusiforme G11]|uniref:RRM domain-containing protein n=1 Tax=Cronartium quercuum f. sp. fusiforme G11 TaxID=708437 RepID=A0A9P6N582_9BASI|nr:hypothetical protein CROQUDRAFT_471008 [Cronartium quercuum f. sp. fusiforme G11]
MASVSPPHSPASTDWANGPATTDQVHTNGTEDSTWHRAPPTTGERGGRSPSPRRVNNRDRSRSPARNSTNDDRGRSTDVANPGNNLHVSGISLRVEDQDLDELFAKYGKVQKSQLMRDPHTRESRGFGFVTMETKEEAEAAIAGLNGHELMGKMLSVEKARRSRGRTPTPGQYHGPPKRDDGHRPYEPRGGYYARYDPYDRRDRGYDDRRYDDRPRYRYDDRRDDRYGYAAPMRERYDDRYDRRRDDRDYDRRRY